MTRPTTTPQRSVVVAAAVIDTEPDYLDVDVIDEDCGLHCPSENRTLSRSTTARGN